ncbi:hypothetical protein ACSNOK_15830 [Streptomyces sp. URMC 126]|uniref:hypothetical protein n=1 Tax=Streptomyces sp. URMC 126 TaxID=3423401 RepID=UPI003F1A73DF
MTTSDGVTDGIKGFLVEIRNHGATAAFWKSLGQESVVDAEAFAPARAAEFAEAFTPTHWGVRQALVLNPDGRTVVLEAPLQEGHRG